LGSFQSDLLRDVVLEGTLRDHLIYLPALQGINYTQSVTDRHLSNILKRQQLQGSMSLSNLFQYYSFNKKVFHNILIKYFSDANTLVTSFLTTREY